MVEAGLGASADLAPLEADRRVVAGVAEVALLAGQGGQGHPAWAWRGEVNRWSFFALLRDAHGITRQRFNFLHCQYECI